MIDIWHENTWEVSGNFLGEADHFKNEMIFKFSFQSISPSTEDNKRQFDLAPCANKLTKNCLIIKQIKAELHSVLLSHPIKINYY